MKRFLIAAVAAAVLVGGTPVASAQTYNRNAQTHSQNRNSGATAWGDPWLNENDFDYNERHWLPGPGDTRRGYSYDYDHNQNRYGGNTYDYDRRDRYGNSWGRDHPEDRYHRPYNRNDDRYGFNRNYRPDNRYRHHDDD